MMTATPNEVCLTAHWASIASLATNGSSIILSEAKKHHIAAGDASLRIARLCLDLLAGM